MVADARKQVGQVSQQGVSEPYVSLEFTEEGKQLFAEATKNNIGKQIAIVLDDEIVSAPVVNTEITESERLSARF